MRLGPLVLLAACRAVRAAYWMEEIAHRGVASFNPDKSYQVFRNVRDFGAKGDGVTDDTDAVNEAISSGGRCGGGIDCGGSTTTPAVVYFPSGTYLVSGPVVPYFHTQLIGNPASPPTLRGAPSFEGLAVVDGDPFTENGLRFQATNTFFRQVRNFVIDTRAVNGSAVGLHWPTAQATGLQNIVFRLAADPRRGHVGILIEEGSGGYAGDLVFEGGAVGARLGNQQFTMRNLTFIDCETAISQSWSWGWTYRNIHVVGAKVGINATTEAVGSVSVFDSSFRNVETAIVNRPTANASSLNVGANALTLENVKFENVATLLDAGDRDASLPGGDSGVQETYLMGHAYGPEGPLGAAGVDRSYTDRPAVLLENGEYLARSKPQYENTPASLFYSARARGAAGDGVSDDTQALNDLFRSASADFGRGAVAFLDAGHYLVTDTVYIPPDTRVVGETLAAVIVGAGARFADVSRPHPVVRVGRPGEKGYVEWSDTLVTGRGATAGAVFVEYNLDTPAAPPGERNEPSGLWDVHVRVGGAVGDDLGTDRCPVTQEATGDVNPDCICGYLSMHLTNTSHNLYMENNWLWTSDHSIDDKNATRINIFNARGLHVASAKGRIWLSGTSVEHHTLYQYSLANTRDIFLGQIQTETPYYQPNPPAPFPFTTPDQSLYDPPFEKDCAAASGSGSSAASADVGVVGLEISARAGAGAGADAKGIACRMAWGLIILGSRNIRVAGAGLYSFFNNYSTDCSQETAGAWRCQQRIFHVGKTPALPDYTPAQGIAPVDDVVMYGLNTVGTRTMIHREEEDLAYFLDHKSGFAAAVAQFRY